MIFVSSVKLEPFLGTMVIVAGVKLRPHWGTIVVVEVTLFGNMMAVVGIQALLP